MIEMSVLSKMDIYMSNIISNKILPTFFGGYRQKNFKINVERQKNWNS